LRVFENRVLRRIFGSKRHEVEGGWRELRNEKFQFDPDSKVKEDYSLCHQVSCYVKFSIIYIIPTPISKRWLLPTSPHGVTTQKTTIHIFATEKTSNLMYLQFMLIHQHKTLYLNINTGMLTTYNFSTTKQCNHYMTLEYQIWKRYGSNILC
jgi:hypothetical protein